MFKSRYWRETQLKKRFSLIFLWPAEARRVNANLVEEQVSSKDTFWSIYQKVGRRQKSESRLRRGKGKEREDDGRQLAKNEKLLLASHGALFEGHSIPAFLFSIHPLLSIFLLLPFQYRLYTVLTAFLLCFPRQIPLSSLSSPELRRRPWSSSSSWFTDTFSRVGKKEKKLSWLVLYLCMTVCPQDLFSIFLVFFFQTHTSSYTKWVVVRYAWRNNTRHMTPFLWWQERFFSPPFDLREMCGLSFLPPLGEERQTGVKTNANSWQTLQGDDRLDRIAIRPGTSFLLHSLLWDSVVQFCYVHKPWAMRVEGDA